MNKKNKHTYELRVQSSTDNLQSIRDFIHDKAAEQGIGRDVVEKIVLAVDEASTNIIKHAYHSSPDGDIIISLSFTDSECVITLKDFGNGFNMGKIKAPDMKKYLKEKRVGGLGIHLMKILMDHVEYTSVQGKYNKLILKKKLSA